MGFENTVLHKRGIEYQMSELKRIDFEEIVPLGDHKSLTPEQRKAIELFRKKLREYDDKMDVFKEGKRENKPTWPLDRPSVEETKSGEFKPANAKSKLIILAHRLEGFETVRCHTVPAKKKAQEPSTREVPRVTGRSDSQKPTRKTGSKVAKTGDPGGGQETPPEEHTKSPMNEEIVEFFDWKAFDALTPAIRRARAIRIIDAICKQFEDHDRRRFLTALMRLLGDEGIIVTPEDLHSPDYARKMKFAW